MGVSSASMSLLIIELKYSSSEICHFFAGMWCWNFTNCCMCWNLVCGNKIGIFLESLLEN